MHTGKTIENVAVLIKELNIGGAEKQCIYIAKAFCNRFNTYLIVFREDTTNPQYMEMIKELNITIIFLKGNYLKKTFQLIKNYKKNRIDVTFSLLFISNFLGTFVHKLIKNHYHISSIRNCVIPKWKKLIQRFMHNFLIEYTIFNNYSGKENMIRAGFNPSKCYVINNCIDPIPEPILRREKRDIYILTVARFKAQKNLITSIKAIEYIVRNTNITDVYKIKYFLIGYGEQEKHLRKRIFELGLNNYCKIIIKPENIEEYFISSDIYLSTSLYEGFSNSIMEALSYSLPVVATDVGDNNKLVHNNKNGFLVKPISYIEVANNLLQLINSYKKRIEFGKNGYNYLKSNYTFTKFQKKYLEFISILMS